MTLQLPPSTRQTLLETLAGLMDGGAPGVSTSGQVEFVTSVDATVTLIDSNATTPPTIPFFSTGDDSGNPVTAKPLNIEDLEDDGTTAGLIAWAIFKNVAGDEIFRSDVAPSSADIVMTNPSPSTGEPVRLATYQIEAQQDN